MKRLTRTRSRSEGFTLVEIIITIIVAGILSAFFIQFLGTALEQSSKSVDFVQDEAAAEATMEEIIADFVAAANADPATALATIADESYGANVTMQYIDYTVAGGIGQEQAVGSSDTLKVTIDAEGNDLTMLLTRSRLSGSPKIDY
jgi:prepilin-type N-terminal cleavage/methylation domain-containing protein